MDGDPSYDALGRQLVSTVPELTERYDTLLQAWGDDAPGPHVVFGDVLNPYLLDLLASRETADQQSTTLRRVFAFLERLAQDADPLVREVVATTVCERLGDDPDVLALSRPYMGEATRRLSQAVEAFWGVGAADGPEVRSMAAAKS